MFSLIAAVGKNHELGQKGQLVFHLQNDINFFRQTTNGHKVVMGRKTWESLPSKLKNRENIVISRQNFSGPDQIIHNVDDFIKKNQATNEEIFIIGGEAIYSIFLPYAKNLYLTEIDLRDLADSLGHIDLSPWRSNIEFLALIPDDRCSVYGHRAFICHLFHELFHALQVAISHVAFHGCELRAVVLVHTLVSEDFAHLVYTVESADYETLEFELERDPEP